MRNNKLNKREKGITLVALVVTIIVLLILAGVTITVLFGDNGIIVRAERAERITKIETTRERMETAGVATILEGLGKTNINEYFEKLEQEGIIGNKDTNVKDNGDGSYNVTTTEEIIFKVTPLPDEDNTTSIKVEYVGDATGPIINDIKIEKTTNSIKIEVIGEGIEDATYKYEYKKEGETSWQTSETTGESTYTIENLTEGETYNIIITIETSEGTVTREINVLMGEIPEETITFTNKQWLGDGTASVVINTTAEGYQLQYQVNGIEENGWQNIESGGTVNNLTYPSTVFARLWDGTNESEHASASLEDSTEPIISKIETSNITSNSVTLTVTASDAQSGLATSKTYKYYLNEEKEARESSQSNSYIYQNLTAATSYTLKVIVTDKAGNEAIETTTEITAENYIGSYADVSGDGKPDGIIYADLAVGGSGRWGNSTVTYTIPTGSDFKEYYKSGTHTTTAFGTADVISTDSTSGSSRFYVMALADIDSQIHYWYLSAYRNWPDWNVLVTSTDFGTGRSNTANMMSKWNSSAYGSQNSNDLWGLIKTQVNNGWYVPSRDEWYAFSDAIGVTKDNFLEKGMGYNYWTSSESTRVNIHAMSYQYGGDFRFNIDVGCMVRLGTDF